MSAMIAAMTEGASSLDAERADVRDKIKNGWREVSRMRGHWFSGDVVEVKSPAGAVRRVPSDIWDEEGGTNGVR